MAQFVAAVMALLLTVTAPSVLSQSGFNTDDVDAFLARLDRAVVAGVPHLNDWAIVEFQSTFGSLAGDDLTALSSVSLRGVFTAAYATVYYSGDPGVAVAMSSIRDELARRGADTRGEDPQLLDALMSARLFLRSEELARTSQHLKDDATPPFVTTVIESGKSAIAIDPNSLVLSRVPLAFGSGPQVIIVVHPNCHFSVNAATELARDKRFDILFAGKALWLAPVEGSIDFVGFRRWDEQFPGAEIAIAWSLRDWPQITSWETPSFYFYMDGKLISSVHGWPESGVKDELLAGMAGVGLAPGAADL